ncbi:MAG: AMP-binding protein [Caldilineaceae bacterium]|nr:AMP-binding protein [Caldilineaceae bacterium]
MSQNSSAAGDAGGNETFPFGQPIVWQPDATTWQQSNIQRLMTRHGIADYATLQARAVADVAWFWEAVMEDLGIEFYRPYTQMLDLSEGMEFPHWCVDGEMNIVHNCLDKWQNSPARDQLALRYEGEEGITTTYTYAELHEAVCRCANGLTELGLGKGDAVGLYMPMCAELAIALLAVVKIGGIILPLFSGYGHSAIVSRLTDAGAKAIFTADGMWRRGRAVAMKPVVDQAATDVPTLCHVIVLNRVGLEDVPWTEGRDHWWHELIARQPEQAETARTSAEDVLMVIYTSGTTGKPKGAVHTHCGFPIKGAQDMRHGMDVRAGDTLYWLTDMGWMMGPWVVFGTLLNGATMLLYDGAPDYPDVDRVWALVERHRVTHFGASPTLFRSLKRFGADPVQRHDLSSLRILGSTGSPWDPESWMWLFNTVSRGRLPILNYSGGTEISGGILIGTLFDPCKACAFGGPVLGMDVDVVDEQGQSVRGAVGELVIRKPWIGMTRGFWGDRERYLDAYWSRMPGLWVHGDFAAIDSDGLWYILGRSDDTIKIAGKRLGPAEVEAILNAHEAIIESAAVGVPHPIKDQEVVAFCVLKPGQSASEPLREELLELVAKELGKPLRPREIRFVEALPKTRSAKVMHRVIRAAYLELPLGDLTSLEDPQTLDAIRHAR